MRPILGPHTQGAPPARYKGHPVELAASCLSIIFFSGVWIPSSHKKKQNKKAQKSKNVTLTSRYEKPGIVTLCLLQRSRLSMQSHPLTTSQHLHINTAFLKFSTSQTHPSPWQRYFSEFQLSTTSSTIRARHGQSHALRKDGVVNLAWKWRNSRRVLCTIGVRLTDESAAGSSYGGCSGGNCTEQPFSIQYHCCLEGVGQQPLVC